METDSRAGQIINKSVDKSYRQNLSKSGKQDAPENRASNAIAKNAHATYDFKRILIASKALLLLKKPIKIVIELVVRNNT